jgi:hypothetical protein
MVLMELQVILKPHTQSSAETNFPRIRSIVASLPTYGLRYHLSADRLLAYLEAAGGNDGAPL